MNNNPGALWEQSLSLIKGNVTEQQFNTWFKPIVFESFNEETLTLLVQVPSPFVYEYLEENFVDLLRKVLSYTFGNGVRLTYRIVTDKSNNLTQDIQAEPTAQIDRQQPRTRANQSPTVLDAAKPQPIDSQLNPHLTFSNFIEGDSNKVVDSRASEQDLFQPDVYLRTVGMWKDPPHQCYRRTYQGVVSR